MRAPPIRTHIVFWSLLANGSLRDYAASVSGRPAGKTPLCLTMLGGVIVIVNVLCAVCVARTRIMEHDICRACIRGVARILHSSPVSAARRACPFSSVGPYSPSRLLYIYIIYSYIYRGFFIPTTTS